MRAFDVARAKRELTAAGWTRSKGRWEWRHPTGTFTAHAKSLRQAYKMHCDIVAKMRAVEAVERERALALKTKGMK